VPTAASLLHVGTDTTAAHHITATAIVTSMLQLSAPATPAQAAACGLLAPASAWVSPVLLQFVMLLHDPIFYMLISTQSQHVFRHNYAALNTPTLAQMVGVVLGSKPRAGAWVSMGGREEDPSPDQPAAWYIRGNHLLHVLLCRACSLAPTATAAAITAVVAVDFPGVGNAGAFVLLCEQALNHAQGGPFGDPGGAGQWQVVSGLQGMRSNGEILFMVSVLAASGVAHPAHLGRSNASDGGKFDFLAEISHGDYCWVAARPPPGATPHGDWIWLGRFVHNMIRDPQDHLRIESAYSKFVRAFSANSDQHEPG
jgi:hypothetical protein